MFFPWLVPFFPGMIYKMKNNIKGILKYLSEEFIKEHQRDFDTENPRDFLDLYLIEMSKEVNEENKEALKTFNIEQLQHVIGDLFAGGTETGSTTIKWALLFMIHHPKIQEKVQAEIDEVIGKERLPTMEDKRLLPFTTATLQEVERLASVAPFGVPRSNDKPAEFAGYKFPENSIFLFNLYNVHRDPTYWKNPLDFDPNRFIDKDGKDFRPPYLMPFGSGKRGCVGESMAKMEIFLLFVTLLQRFTFEQDGNDLPILDTGPRSLDRSPSAVYLCKNFSFTKSKRSLKAECVLDFKLLCSCQCNRKARKFQDAFIAIAAILSILTHLLTSSGPGRKMPPGPIGIPIFGNMPCYFISDYEMIKEMSNHPDVQHRPAKGLFREIIKGRGISDSEGSVWKHQRRFVLQALRDVGMGKRKLEEKIQDEIIRLCHAIEKANGVPIDLKFHAKKHHQ
ncbi:Cytochrome P450 2U1 [Nymphon striatum]|nr:Cytochrome P450 2U1 [Nymphon striatum]